LKSYFESCPSGGQTDKIQILKSRPGKLKALVWFKYNDTATKVINARHEDFRVKRFTAASPNDDENETRGGAERTIERLRR